MSSLLCYPLTAVVSQALEEGAGGETGKGVGVALFNLRLCLRLVPVSRLQFQSKAPAVAVCLPASGSLGKFMATQVHTDERGRRYSATCDTSS